jgi:hypothetical protein
VPGRGAVLGRGAAVRLSACAGLTCASPVLARRLQVHYDSCEGRSARGWELPPAGLVASRVGGGRGGPGVRAVCREGSHGRLAALCVCGAVVRRPFGSQAISLCPCRGCSVDGGVTPRALESRVSGSGSRAAPAMVRVVSRDWLRGRCAALRVCLAGPGAGAGPRALLPPFSNVITTPGGRTFSDCERLLSRSCLCDWLVWGVAGRRGEGVVRCRARCAYLRARSRRGTAGGAY